MIRYIILSCILLFSCICEATEVFTGISYSQPNLKNIVVHVLTVDPTKVKIIAVRAQDAGYDLQTVETIAKHFSALAAINGGFFRFNNEESKIGFPAGVLKINNYWYGIAYTPRGAIGWNPETNAVMLDIIDTDSNLVLASHILPIRAMNNLSNRTPALLSDSYTYPIPITDGLALLIKDQKIQQLCSDGIFNVLPGTYVFAMRNSTAQQFKDLAIGMPANVDIKIRTKLEKNAKQWEQMPFIVAAGPLLIKNSRVITDYSNEKLNEDFIYKRYARTAIGILPNMHWVFVVAEKNPLQPESGWTLAELSDFMQQLGCVAAVNLDGGGSSAMYLQDQFMLSTQNFVSNMLNAERPVANALLVLPREIKQE